MFGLTTDYFISYSASTTGAGTTSRSASREAEGTGPVTPRQPVPRDVVPSPAERTVRSEDVERRTKGAPHVSATALKCRVCETAYPLDPIGVCAKCFGPLEPVYDRDEQRRTVTHASIEAGPPSIWRYADLLPVAPPPLGAGAKRRAGRAGPTRRRDGVRAARPAPPRRLSESLVRGSLHSVYSLPEAGTVPLRIERG